ncbi:phosphoribosylanthranilate isomerase [Paenibacillus sp. NPDC058071]|uniref:phosphoribosylanthranilate isomerase n=1 Tax=Paenibacillus sp. NPDC058071 TaxID=3346326 RepID=UPI0036D99A8E
MTDCGRTPRIKICGLRDEETIAQMNGLAFDELGFVFAPSKRQVAPAEAGKLAQAVSRIRTAGGESPRTVGVFVNAQPEELAEAVRAAGLNVAQLHGAEDAEYCLAVKRELAIDVWKVFSIGKENEEASAAERLAPFRGAIDAVLVDTAGGGTGRTFDWQLIETYRQAAAEIGVPLYVAGGLHPGNVRELLDGYRPDGIDVSSGVETDGRKDIDKIKLFIEKVIQR